MNSKCDKQNKNIPYKLPVLFKRTSVSFCDSDVNHKYEINFDYSFLGADK